MSRKFPPIPPKSNLVVPNGTGPTPEQFAAMVDAGRRDAVLNMAKEFILADYRIAGAPFDPEGIDVTVEKALHMAKSLMRQTLALDLSDLDPPVVVADQPLIEMGVV